MHSPLAHQYSLTAQRELFLEGVSCTGVEEVVSLEAGVKSLEGEPAEDLGATMTVELHWDSSELSPQSSLPLHNVSFKTHL